MNDIPQQAVAQLVEGVSDRALLQELIRRAESEGDWELTRNLLLVVRLLDSRLRAGRKTA